METYPLDRTVNAFVNDNINYPTQYRKVDLLATPQPVGTDARTLYGWNIYNPNTVDVFVKLYNKASTPSVGSDAVKHTIQVAAGGSVVIFGSDQYMYFDARMWVAVVTGYADTNSTAPSLGVLTQIHYK